MSWLYVATICIALAVCVALMLSPLGRIRLGDDDARPEFSTFSWLAMLFSAGAGALALDELRAVYAMRIAYMHWGIHGWAAYAIVGLCLAYFSFRKKLPLTLRSALYPVIGERIYGLAGDAVDLLAVFGTVFGVATSLGLGATQMATGLNVLVGLDPGRVTQVALIAAIAAALPVSAVLLMMMYGLVKSLVQDPGAVDAQERSD